MRLFKATYKEDGQKRFSRKWYLDFTGPDEVRHRIPAFEDKRQSEALGRRIEDLVSLSGSGLTPNLDMQQWIDGLPKWLLRNLVACGLIGTERAAVGHILREHLADFRRNLGDTPHARQTENALGVAFDACEFKTWADVSGSKFQQHLQQRLSAKEISQRTYNWSLGAARHFGRWMIRDGRTHSNPFEYLRRLEVTDAKRRRAFTTSEMGVLLATTAGSGELCSLPGPVRSLLYRLGAETGLRLSELLSLLVSSFNFTENTVTVKAGDAKNRRAASLPLRPETAAMLKEYLRNRLPNAKVFVVSGGAPALSSAFKVDLKGAGIDAADNGSGRLCFHSLRHTTATMLAAAGVHPKVAMDFMRHSDVNLTLARYSHTLRGQLSEAAARLPDFSVASQAQAGKTGTDDSPTGPGEGRNHFAICLAKMGGNGRTSLDSTGPMESGAKCQEPAIEVQNRRFLSSSGGLRGTGELGVGPRLTDPESVVLPLHYSPVLTWITRVYCLAPGVVYGNSSFDGFDV